MVVYDAVFDTILPNYTSKVDCAIFYAIHVSRNKCSRVGACKAHYVADLGCLLVIWDYWDYWDFRSVKTCVLIMGGVIIS